MLFCNPPALGSISFGELISTLRAAKKLLPTYLIGGLAVMRCPLPCRVTGISCGQTGLRVPWQLLLTADFPCHDGNTHLANQGLLFPNRQPAVIYPGKQLTKLSSKKREKKEKKAKRTGRTRIRTWNLLMEHTCTLEPFHLSCNSFEATNFLRLRCFTTGLHALGLVLPYPPVLHLISLNSTTEIPTARQPAAVSCAS